MWMNICVEIRVIFFKKLKIIALISLIKLSSPNPRCRRPSPRHCRPSPRRPSRSTSGQCSLFFCSEFFHLGVWYFGLIFLGLVLFCGEKCYCRYVVLGKWCYFFAVFVGYNIWMEECIENFLFAGICCVGSGGGGSGGGGGGNGGSWSGCDCCLLYRIYYFLVMYILFYYIKS